MWLDCIINRHKTLNGDLNIDENFLENAQVGVFQGEASLVA